MRRLSWFSIVILSTALANACGDDPYVDPPHVDAAPNDGSLNDVVVIPDVPVLPDRVINEDGPSITIQTPQPMAVLSGSQAQIVATVTDPDGVDVSSVRAIIPGGAVFTMSRTGTQNDQYSGIIDLSTLPTGQMSIIVEAADILATWNSAQVAVTRDKGPIVQFISPVQGGRYAGSVNLVFVVSDPGGVRETSVTAQIGSVGLDIVTQGSPNPNQIQFGGEIVFEDAMFSPPLRGVQQVTVTAENINNSVQSTSAVTFTVDDEGPTIVVNTPLPGEIVGGIITIEADVQDDAGVLLTSVLAILGNNAYEYIVQLEPIGGVFSGTFDTTLFPHNFVFPPLSVRAADSLNNESEVGFVLALDNTKPVLSLDPPETTRIAELGECYGVPQQVVCAQQFDPVGAGVPNDLDTVPQVFWLRARVEDRGNDALGLLQIPLSLIDYATPRAYFLSDTSQALVVDTDGDGFCDEINPALIPSTNPQGSNEILALSLGPIAPTGDPDYRLDLSPLPAGCDCSGDDTDPPPELCIATRPEGMSVAMHYTVDPSEPAIWSLPPINSSDPLFCAGHQFDALASNISEGWTCIAVRAKDNAGNVGVSEPLRVCVDYTLDGVPTECANTGLAPDCTGTWNPVTQTVDTNNPCDFDPYLQLFRDNEIRMTP